MNRLKVWADYLFLILKDAPEENQFPVAEEDIAQVMASNEHGDVALEEDDKIYEKGDKFKSFHCQANQTMSQKALRVGFLSVWLKKCVAHLLYIMESPLWCSSRPFS